MGFLLRFVALASSVSLISFYSDRQWVNGVDQGSGVGIREPGYNGAYPTGYANSPVRDLNSIDLRCNVLGDVQDPNTIKVKPGDVVTLEWHHNNRTAADDIIDKSHKGAGLVYLSPDPPTSTSWIKIQEEGEITPGYWYVTGKHTERQGKQDVQIPNGLAPGFYLLRSELLALHEADVSHQANPNRGIQIYISCVQIQVTGNGTTPLPAGVGFPGAYGYNTPGIVYNIYSTAATATGLYPIPGPTVWSGAAASPDAPAYGTTLGYTVAPKWSTWIGNGFSTATAATSLTVVTGASTVTKTYVANWPTTYVTPAPAPAATQAKYGQCGGTGYTGPTACAVGSTCTYENDYYSQCM